MKYNKSSTIQGYIDWLKSLPESEERNGLAKFIEQRFKAHKENGEVMDDYVVTMSKEKFKKYLEFDKNQ